MASEEDHPWAREVLQDIDEGRLRGCRLALRIRARIESCLFKFGCFAHRHCGKIVAIALIVLIFFASTGLASHAKLETNAEKLWVEVGGRLADEIEYTEKMLGKEFGITQEVMIQTPNQKGTNILTIDAMLMHMKALKKVAMIKVKVEDREWSLRDLCYKPNLPAFDDKLLQRIMVNLVPCTFITPMDCFWEGAKIHGPEINVALPETNQHLKWTTLNPVGLLNEIQRLFYLFPWEVENIRLMFAEAGISTGYLEKPCLNPNDPECPSLAPNKRSKKVPDVGSVLTGGCNGFAANYMKWQEELIIGGVVKNRSGTIRSAAALQSAVLLMGAPNLLEYYQDEDWAKEEYIYWNITTTRNILKAWQKEFTKVMKEITDPRRDDFSILAFASESFNELLKDFSNTSTVHLAMGYLLMIIYSGLTLKRWKDAVKSHCGVGVAGVLLVTLSVASGLGFSSFCGIAFNAASTQVLPFLALGLGVDDMFLLAHSYASISDRGDIHPSDQVGYALGNTGVSIFLTSFNNMFAFFMATIIPIPALRAFSFQAGVIVVFNYLAVIIVYPAMLAIDLKRKQDQRYDLFCCFQRSGPQRICITPNTSTDSDLVLRRYHNSNSSLSSMSSTNIHASAAVVALPGSVQATASGAVSLPGTVTVMASAVADLGNNSMLPLSVSGLADLDDLVSMNTLGANDARPRGRPCFERGNRTQANECAEIVPRFSNTRFDAGRKQVRQAPRINNRAFEQTLHPSSLADGPSRVSSQTERSRNSANSSWVEATSSYSWEMVKEKLKHVSLSNFAKHYYGPWLQKNSVKILVIFMFAILVGAGAYGCMLVRDGLDLTDVVPRNSTEHKFVTAQMNYFSIYPMYLVTKKDFDYPNKQKLLYKYHEAFKSVPNVVKTPEMNLRPFWLIFFRNWLKDIQKAFDRDWALGTIDYTGWKENASDSGMLGYKMLIQTGDEDIPINRSQVRSVRLVDDEGIINAKAFYNYLTVWYNVDPMGYTSSQANIRPKPGNWANIRDPKEYHNINIDPAKPIEFAQIMFYLVNFKDTEEYVRVIKEVRGICKEFESRGLPSYPSGIPFTFWEQYIWLRHYLFMAIGVILAVSFVVIMIILWNVRAVIIIIFILTMITFQVFGFMGLAGIKLSAVPAVTLILSVGVGVEFTVHMCLAFQTAVGDRNRRMQKAIEQVFSPITDGAVSTLLGVIMLAGSDFDFIVRYFFHLLCALILIGFINGLLFLPTLLSLVGPPPEAEETRPPGTASSAGSQRELLPVSCRRTPPTDSQICILDASTTYDSKQEDRTESSRRHRKKKRPDNCYRSRRVHGGTSRSSPSRVQYDLESTSSVVARVTATATVTVEVKAEQRPVNERTVSERTCDRNDDSYRTSDGRVTVVDLDDCAEGK